MAWVHRDFMRPFKEARAYVQKLKIKSHKEWVLILYCQNKLKGFKEKPQDIPKNPAYYKNEFKGVRIAPKII